MRLYSTKAIVIKSVNFSEADKIVTLYTESYGKIGVIAKGARRINSRFGSSLELGTLINALFYESERSNLSNIRQSNIIDSFREIRENFDFLSGCFYILSLVNEMTKERQQNESLFKLLLESLSGFSKIGDIFKSIAIFEIKLLKILGYEPNLRQCSECKAEISGAGIKFSVAKTGVLCKRCGEVWDNLIPMSVGAIKSLEKMRDWDIVKLANLKLSSSLRGEIEKILYPCIRYHVGKEIKGRRFFEKNSCFFGVKNNEIAEAVS